MHALWTTNQYTSFNTQYTSFFVSSIPLHRVWWTSRWAFSFLVKSLTSRGLLLSRYSSSGSGAVNGWCVEVRPPSEKLGKIEEPCFFGFNFNDYILQYFKLTAFMQVRMLCIGHSGQTDLSCLRLENLIDITLSQVSLPAQLARDTQEVWLKKTNNKEGSCGSSYQLCEQITYYTYTLPFFSLTFSSFKQGELVDPEKVEAFSINGKACGPKNFF